MKRAGTAATINTVRFQPNIVVPDSDEASLGDARWASLIDANEKLASAKSVEAVVGVLRDTAREIVQSDGIAIIIREDDKCFYAAEDAIAPLWSARRFPAASCISGWAMMHRETVAISDIRLDSRIPQEAYRPTFVRSLVMVPIGAPEARAAIGAYWSDVRTHDARTVARLEALARFAAISLENVRLMTAIAESERQRETALAAGRMGTWTLDLESREMHTSPTCRMNLGHSLDREISYEQFLAAIHATDADQLRESMEESVATGEEFGGEYRIRTCDGVRWIVLRGKPGVTAGRGRIVSGVSTDVTQRKLMEEQLRDMAATLERRVKERTEQLTQAHAALRQSQKLEVMGQLTGGVAHDFNNLLAPILGSLDLLKRRGVGGDREKRLIEGALESAHRAKALVHRLLAFARRQPLKPTAVDLGALLTEMTPLIATTLGPQIPLALKLAPELPAAVADPNQVEMAVLNLAANARDAMPSGGQLSISTRIDEIGEGHRTGMRAGRYVRIAVVDTGCGMSEETTRRAVEPFFSTKGVGKGAGLGLSMVLGLASQLGGALALNSTLGLGTEVELWLPVSSEQPVVAPDAFRSLPLVPGVALLVDDEDLVRSSTADMLAEMGFRVVESHSGEDALDKLSRLPHIDLLITDHLMPSMSGTELARAVLKERPRTAILVISGYSEASDLPPDLPHAAPREAVSASRPCDHHRPVAVSARRGELKSEARRCMMPPAALIEKLRNVHRLVILTGAGVSQESGIPTFRDRQTGLWSRFDAAELATPEAFERDPPLVWGWYEWRRGAVRRAEPNAAHHAIALLARKVPELTLVTQNVDDLHERAGSPQVLHLHGRITHPYCESCRRAHTVSGDLVPEDEGRLIEPPRCASCGARVRPGVVWFGEALPVEEWHAAHAAAQRADLFLCVGTSSLVQPAASLTDLAARAGATTVQVNPNSTGIEERVTFSLRGPAGTVLPLLLAHAWP